MIKNSSFSVFSFLYFLFKSYFIFELGLLKCFVEAGVTKGLFI